MIAYDELSKDILPNKMGWSMDTSTIAAGGISRAFSALIVSPLELIRTQQQSSNAIAKQGVLRGIQNIMRADGALSLWRGYTATCWRDVPFSIVYWYGFEAFKARILDPAKNNPIRHYSFLTSFVAGGGSGMIAAFVTTPFDVIKTRRQVIVGGGTGGGGEARTARLLLDVMRSEGVSALFSGVVPRVVKVAPACGMVIGTYSYVQELAGRWI
jgi:solute carrier family 25 protein 39/40